MRVLALADRPFHADVAKLAAQTDVEAILTLGDLQPSWLETLDNVCLPKLGVYGNHDDGYMPTLGIADLHLRWVEVGGVSFCGFEGCVRYREGPHQFTQAEAASLARALPAADVLVCHAPPAGVNDEPDDRAHLGFQGLREWVDVHAPRWILHGHTHPRPGGGVRRVGASRVLHIAGARVVEV